ncbi:MAG: hypothetical protein R3F20_15475 [Planctomycetota bacterium]
MKGLLENLLGLSLDGARRNGEWRVEWNGLPEGGDGILLLIALVAAIAWGVTKLYRRDAGHLAPRARRGLAALRIGACVIALVMFLQPQLVVDRVESVPSNLVILRDDSSSMEVKDGEADDPALAQARAAALGVDEPASLAGMTRRERLERLLAGSFVEDLAAGGARRVHVHGFADRFFLDAPADPEIARRSREHTALGSALEEALAAYQGPPLAGVVVLGDGRSNAGASLDRAARQFERAGVPIHAVVVGGEREPRNAAVAGVEVNEIVFVRDPIEVKVTVEGRGLEGETTEVRLEKSRDGGAWETVGTKEISFLEEGRLSEVAFGFSETEEGEIELRAVVEPVPGEVGEDDNSSSGRTRVVKKQLRVLLVAGLAFPEVQFLTNTLMRDPGIEASTWLMFADPEYAQKGNTPIERLPNSAEELDVYDCVVLYDTDLRQLPPNFTSLLVDFVGRSGGGLVYLAGESATADIFDRKHPAADDLLAILPVVREPGLFQTQIEMRLGATTEWRLDVTPAGRESGLFDFGADPEKTARILRDLPGFYWHFPITRPKPGASVLARHGDDRMSNQYGRLPVVVTQLYGPGRTFFLALDSTYRWRYLDENHYDGFWARIINRAGVAKRLGGRQPLALSSDRAEFAPGEVIQLRARLPEGERLGADLPSLAGQVEVSGEEIEPLVLRPDAADPNLYVGTYRIRRGGAHLVRVWASEENQEGARAATFPFDARRPDRELMTPSADRPALARLAEATGGTVHDLADAGRVSAAIATGFVDLVDQDRQELWDAPLLFVLLLGLIFLEWVLRKRNRLV